MNRFSIKLAAITLLLCGLIAVPASAHHSFAMFDRTKMATIEGTVKQFAWTNPHVVLWVIADPKEGEPDKTWFLELTSPGNLTRLGLTKRSFKAGDKVKVQLHPLLSGETGGEFIRATLVDSGQVVDCGKEVGEGPPAK